MNTPNRFKNESAAQMLLAAGLAIALSPVFAASAGDQHLRENSRSTQDQAAEEEKKTKKKVKEIVVVGSETQAAKPSEQNQRKGKAREVVVVGTDTQDNEDKPKRDEH